MYIAFQFFFWTDHLTHDTFGLPLTIKQYTYICIIYMYKTGKCIYFTIAIPTEYMTVLSH